MNLFYRNQRLLVLSICLIIVAGLSSFVVLPRAEDPALTPRFGLVKTIVPGASAGRVEALVTEKIEEQLRDIEEIKQIDSTSRANVSSIVLELDGSVKDVDEIWSRVRDTVADAEPELPSSARAPEFEEVKLATNTALAALVWKGDGDTNFRLLRRTANRLRDHVKWLSSTDSVGVFGAPDEEYVVAVAPERLAQLDLQVTDVVQQLKQSDAKLPAGHLRRADSNLQIKLDTELDSSQRIASVPIRASNDSQILELGDVADISRGILEPIDTRVLVHGHDAIVLGIRGRPELRIDRTTRQLESAFDEFRKQLPAGIELETIFRQDDYVTRRLSALSISLLLGFCAVFGVSLMMLGWRNGIIVALTLPLSVTMVLAGMRFLDLPIHQMTVIGMIISLGLLIDNAIVVVDELSHRLRSGVSPVDAVTQTTRYLAVPLLGSSLTTALSFTPIALMEGADGEFVGSIAVTVILAIASSLLLAVTVVPAISAIFKRSENVAQNSWLKSGFSFRPLTRLYSLFLTTIYATPILGILIGLCLPVLGALQIGKLPMQFYPPAERDQIRIELDLPAQASLQETRSVALDVYEYLMDNEKIKSIHWFLGEDAPSFYYNVVRRRRSLPSYGQAIVTLRSTEGLRALINELQADLDRQYPEARLLVRQLEQGPPFEAPIEVRIQGPEVDELATIGREVRSILASIPDVTHTRVEIEEGLPRLAVDIDEARARRVGLDHEMIARQLETTFEGFTGGSVLEDTEELPVRVRVPATSRAELAEIESLDVVTVSRRTGQSMAVPLTSIAHLRLDADYAAILRLDGQRVNEVQGYLTAGVLPSKVMRSLRERLSAAKLELPPGYSIDFGGEDEIRNNAVRNLMASVAVLAVMMVATLVLTFNSYAVAAIIGLVALLSAGIAHLCIAVFGFPFGFMAILGTMGLIGVAINDSIIVLAAVLDDKRAAAGDYKATVDVVIRSTRHVLTTTLTTIAGFLPLYLGGGDLWPPLAVCVAGGVAGATILALVFCPAVYLSFHRFLARKSH